MLIGTSVSPLSPDGDLTLPGAQFGAPPEGRSLFVFFPLALEGPEALQFLPVLVTSGPDVLWVSTIRTSIYLSTVICLSETPLSAQQSPQCMDCTKCRHSKLAKLGALYRSYVAAQSLTTCSPGLCLGRVDVLGTL